MFTLFNLYSTCYNKDGDNMEIPTIFTVYGMLMLITAVVYLARTSKIRNQHEITKTYTTTNLQEIEQLMKEHNITYESINHLRDSRGNFTSIQATRTTKYVNRRIVNDTISIEKIPNANFCPNCGEKIDNPNNNICPYCNTNFTITK